MGIKVSAMISCGLSCFYICAFGGWGTLWSTSNGTFALIRCSAASVGFAIASIRLVMSSPIALWFSSCPTYWPVSTPSTPCPSSRWHWPISWHWWHHTTSSWYFWHAGQANHSFWYLYYRQVLPSSLPHLHHPPKSYSSAQPAQTTYSWSYPQWACLFSSYPTILNV